MKSTEERKRDMELMVDEAYKPRVKCRRCRGKSIISNNKICSVCNGTGWIDKEK